MDKQSISRKLTLILLLKILVGCTQQIDNKRQNTFSKKNIEEYSYHYQSDDSSKYLLLQNIGIRECDYDILYGKYPTQNDKADVIILGADTIFLSKVFAGQTDFIPKLSILSKRRFDLDTLNYVVLYGDLVNSPNMVPPEYVTLIEFNKLNCNYRTYGFVTFSPDDELVTCNDNILNYTITKNKTKYHFYIKNGTILSKSF